MPHSFALLGTSGGGKSNTLNHILFSIFYNFETVFELNFIDFKGGVEAQPYQKLEEKYKTGKIFTYADNRLEVYKKLVRLDIIVGTQRIWPARAFTLGHLTHNDLATVRI